MNPHEIIVGKMQSQCGFEVLKLLTEGIGEPCKAPDLHAHSQVLALHAVCGDMLLIGVSLEDGGIRYGNNNATNSIG